MGSEILTPPHGAFRGSRMTEPTVDELKGWVQALATAWGRHYASDLCGLPDGHLHAQHYDILERCGARMDNFTRWEPKDEDLT